MKTLSFWFITALLILTTNGLVFAQPTWVVQDINATMSGAHLYKAGDNCIVHTRASSEFVYFFGVNSKTWVECDLGSQQDILEVEAGGNVAFAYSGSYLIAYSSITSSCQYITYNGNIISPQGTVSGTRGWGCGDNAVYVFTDQNYLYVFDGLIGEWKSYYYGEITNASGGRSLWCGDNYVSGIFHRIYPDTHKNVVYSLVSGTFNQTDQSGVYYSSIDGKAMTGGFVSTFGGGGEDALLTAYSAYTNEFYTVEENTPYGQFVLGYWDEGNWINCKERNVYGYALSRGDAQSREMKINTFDTKRAEWITHTSSYSTAQTGGPSNYIAGGITSLTSQAHVEGPVTFYVYSPETGSYSILTSNILYNLHSYYYIPGFQSVYALDAWDHGWFHNSKTGSTQSIAFEDSIKVCHEMIVDYGFFFRYSDYQPYMDLWFYNSNTDRLSKFRTEKYTSPTNHVKYSPCSFVFKNPASTDEVVFYSPFHDSIITVNTPLTFTNSKGVFSWVYGSGSTLLFDAANLNIVEFPALPVTNVNSDSLLLFGSGNIFSVYDASNKQLSVLDLGSTTAYRNMNGNVVLVSYTDYSKYLALQKSKTTWTELLPEGGNHVGSSVGENTAVVVRQNKLYAFAPELVIDDVDEHIACSSLRPFKLNQNQPNPFAQSSIISYQLFENCNVVVKVFDLLGREVACLVDKDQAEGPYSVEFNAKGLPEGVYLCKLQTNFGPETIKMIVLK